MKNRKRAMVMIMVVILVGAITTIIAASVDLSRMAVYKQKQSEREAKWQYCVESAKSMVVEDMVGLVGTTQNFITTVNGIPITIAASPDLSWNSTTSTQITITGLLGGKSRTTKLYAGKRATVQPCQFAMFFTSKFQPGAPTNINGDIFLDGAVNASLLDVAGDIYSPAATAPNVSSDTGSFFGRQPSQTIVLNSLAYQAQAAISTAGDTTLTNPTYIGFGARSQLRYHDGNLSVTGDVTGEITIFVKGDVTLSNITPKSGFLGRLVVICSGDVYIEPGDVHAFIISSGRIRSSGGAGIRTIHGSLAGDEFTISSDQYSVDFSNVFITVPTLGTRYWIPGQW